MKVLHLYGFPCAGKTTIGKILSKKLNAVQIDGDVIRAGVNSDLGFGQEARVENQRRIGELSKMLTDQGFNVVITTVASYSDCRDKVRQIIGDDNYYEVFINTPLELCEKRDTKGMYKKAREGIIKNFTGVTGEFEIGNPDIVVEFDELEKQVEFILGKVNEKDK